MLKKSIRSSNTISSTMFQFNLCLVFLFCLPHVFSNNINSYKPVESIQIRCGYSGNLMVQNHRNLTGDVNTIYSPIDTPNADPSVPATAPSSPLVDPYLLYVTARLSRSEFTYSFSVTDGQKFIRLHFYPTSYDPNFDRSNSLFSVKAGPYTLLKDFNASLTADNDDDQEITVSREYCINVEPGQRLNISFIPSHSAHPEAYAFINTIEVVSMPTDLYYTKRTSQGIQIVGQINNEYPPVCNNTALETMYRIDVGGAQDIPPHQDTGMFRSWKQDNRYLKHEYSASLSINVIAEPHYTSDVPNYTAPDLVYGKSETSKFNVTWGFRVDAGFNYMVRLYFCEVEPNIRDANDRVFQIFIAEMMAESAADVILWSGGNFVPTIRDYGVMNFKIGNLKKPNLTIKLQQPVGKDTVHLDDILNGIEIFKLSSDYNLGAPNPDPRPSPTPRPGSPFPSGSPVGHESAKLEPLQFDLAVIEAATNNFSHENKIGKGGFGEVYKGILLDGRQITVKKLSKSSKQGANEFKNEVLLIAKLQHRNLVAFIGFCLEEQEKMLVYEYMPNKSLDYFLFDTQRHKLLSWFERHNIIGGIARGILYLHEYSQLKVIHRDLKPSNILLDQNLIPKISDFGLARIVDINQDQGSTDRIVGTYGYMSPEYAMLGQFSEKSDVFSFGVMVLEIITGKKNTSSFESDSDGLLNYVWRQWRNQTPLTTLDPNIKDNYSEIEVIKCIQIGLLCVQQNLDIRPTMVIVVSYLSSDSIKLPTPQEPGFFLHSEMDPKAVAKETSSSKFINSFTQLSINKMSISEFLPR